MPLHQGRWYPGVIVTMLGKTRLSSLDNEWGLGITGIQQVSSRDMHGTHPESIHHVGLLQEHREGGQHWMTN